MITFPTVFNPVNENVGSTISIPAQDACTAPTQLVNSSQSSSSQSLSLTAPTAPVGSTQSQHPAPSVQPGPLLIRCVASTSELAHSRPSGNTSAHSIVQDNAEKIDNAANYSKNTPALVEPTLPFVDEDNCDPNDVGLPAKPLITTSNLKDKIFVLPVNIDRKYDIFVDKVLPPLSTAIEPHELTIDYFVALYNLVNAPGSTYLEGTPNYLGARIPLQHTWRLLQTTIL